MGDLMSEQMNLHKFRLIPSLDVAMLGSTAFLFDRSADTDNIVFVPTQKISKPLYFVIKKIKATHSRVQAYELDDLKALFDNPEDQARVSKLMAAGYLEPFAVQPAMALEQIENSTIEAPLEQTFDAPVSDHLSYFRNSVLRQYFKARSFFNLPAKIESKEVDVGLIGVPISSVAVSDGTVHAPDRLRQASQKAGFWFDFYKDGVYSELACDGTEPKLMCQGVLLKDFGDLGVETRTVGELFGEINHFVESELIPNRIRPIFVGGDHAITFPIVDSLVKHYPDLVLIHLDAHNDLFYTERVEFSHAGPIQGLLLHSGLSKVLSFGLRTNGDTRVGPHSRLTSQEKVLERVSMYSLGATRRRLNDKAAFLQHLIDQVGEDTPCYLTIDLDVLSEDAIGGQLSTPAGHGLEFYELYEFVELTMKGLNVIGCDVVEFNADTRNATNDSQRDTVVLLMQLADGLAEVSRRYANKESAGKKKTVEPAKQNPAKASEPPAGRPLARQDSQKHRDAKHGSSSGLFSNEVERRSIESLTYESFVSEYVIPGVPLVITGGTHFTGTNGWSLEYFLERVLRGTEIQLNTFRSPYRHETAESKSAPFWEMLASMRQRSQADLRESDERYNIVDWNFAFTNPELLADYCIPDFFDMDLSEQFGFQKHLLNWIYIGEEGTGSPSHIDVGNTSAWLYVARGSKHWRFVHNDDTAACGKLGQWADLFAPDLARFKSMENIRGFELVQEPGELVWVPSGCLHAVRNLEPTIALTHNYVDLTNLDKVYEAYISKARVENSSEEVDLAQIFEIGIARLKEKGFDASIYLLQHGRNKLPKDDSKILLNNVIAG
jgi:arginase family enzyme